MAAKSVTIDAGHATLQVRGDIKVVGIDPTQVEFVVRVYHDPEAWVWEVEHLKSGELFRGWSRDEAWTKAIAWLDSPSEQ